MRPRKFVAKGSRHPKVDSDHNIPVKVAFAFFFLGSAVIILTISLVALIVSVKARFDGLTASINSLTMKDEFQREFEKFIFSRRSIENELKARIKLLERKLKNGNFKLEQFIGYDNALRTFENGLQALMNDVTQRYYDYRANSHEPFRKECKEILDKAEKISSQALELKKKVEILDDEVKGIEPRMANLTTYIRDLFPKNFQYYQLGGYPSPVNLWPFLKWNDESILMHVFIQISDDETQFGRVLPGSSIHTIESAFELDFIPASQPELGYYNLKMNPNGSHGLKLDFSQISGLSPPSRRLSFWRLEN